MATAAVKGTVAKVEEGKVDLDSSTQLFVNQYYDRNIAPMAANKEAKARSRWKKGFEVVRRSSQEVRDGIRLGTLEASDLPLSPKTSALLAAPKSLGVRDQRRETRDFAPDMGIKALSTAGQHSIHACAQVSTS